MLQVLLLFYFTVFMLIMNDLGTFSGFYSILCVLVIIFDAVDCIVELCVHLIIDSSDK